ncbi:MAG: type II toxin-antitoxin system RelE/ParE family toxin [Sulfurisoma sp.]|nr:type II toxin-antitoxin system RelE/ParE family toxin [Sulfurisoma sp.]
MKPLAQRERAQRDIEDAFDFHLRDAGAKVASDFVAALDDAFRHLQHHPGTGSMRFAQLLDLPGLRHWRLDRFPYTVFYVERDVRIDVLRVLHQARDIPAQFRDVPQCEHPSRPQ